MSAALLIVTISEVLFVMQKDLPSSGTSAFVLLTFSIVLAVYALITYYRRMFLLSTGETYGYKDHFAPIFLGVVLIYVIVVIFYFNLRKNNLLYTSSSKPLEATHTKYPSNTKEMIGMCMKHDLQGFSLLELQLSGATLDEERSMILVPTENKIMSFPSAASVYSGAYPFAESEITIVADLDSGFESDMESLTRVDDRIFSISEKDHHSTIFEFEWSRDGRTLSLVHE